MLLSVTVLKIVSLLLFLSPTQLGEQFLLADSLEIIAACLSETPISLAEAFLKG